MVYWANVKAGEQVLIITDTKTNLIRVEAVAAVCREVGARVTTIIMPAHELPNQEPPPPVAAAMKSADCIFAPLSMSISHTRARNEAIEKGARYIGMYGTDDELATEGARFPPEIIFAVARVVSEQWRKGKRIRVTCARGTDLTAEIVSPDYVVGWEACVGPIGTHREKGTWLEMFGNFASGFGVVGVWPEWTAEGEIYFDAAHTFPGRLRTPLKYTVRKGRVIKFEGDPEVVEFFEGIVQRFGPDAAHLSELMIGLNPKARLMLDDPTHIEAHRRAGCLHVAIGNSIDPEMRVFPGIHLDNLLIRPTIYIDEEPCVVDGRLLAYDRPEIRALLEKHGIRL